MGLDELENDGKCVQLDGISIIHVNSLIPQFMSTLRTDIIFCTKITIFQNLIEVCIEINNKLETSRK